MVWLLPSTSGRDCPVGAVRYTWCALLNVHHHPTCALRRTKNLHPAPMVYLTRMPAVTTDTTNKALHAGCLAHTVLVGAHSVIDSGRKPIYDI